MSPELLDPDRFGLMGGHPTKESDCYALGMVIYEVLSGTVPFAPDGNQLVIMKVLKGERPRKPRGDNGKLFTDNIWEVVKLCWEARPGDRISAKAILLGLEGELPPLRPSNADGDLEVDSGDQSEGTANDSGVFSPFNLGFNP